MHSLLSNPDFRRLLAGRLVTNAGDSLYAVAAMWLVFSLTGSTLYTGLAGFLTMGPQALQAFVGPLVDRYPLRRVLVTSQAAQGVLVLTVPAAAWLGVLSAPLVLAVMPLVALLNQFVYPAQSAALPRVVEAEELTAANAAFTFAYQGSELVFNALAGLLVAAVGAVSLYLLDSVTFAVAVALFAGLRVPTADEAARAAEAADARAVAADGGREASYLERLREGFAFVRGTVLLPLLGSGVIANALMGSTIAVLPAFADGRGGAGTYGLLMAGIAGGALVGALLASQFQDVPLGRLSMGAFLVGALLWFGALLAPVRPLTVVLFAAAFVPVGVTNVVFQSMVQRLVPEALLGRVTALAGSASTAVMPLGALAGGVAGEALGAEAVMIAGGLGFAWIVAYTAAIPSLRRLPAVTAVETLSTDAA